jgi:hypothetical protein
MDFSTLPQYPSKTPISEPVVRRREFSALDGKVETVVEVLFANPNAEQAEVLDAIEQRGIPPRDAYRLYQFVPIAFVHVVLRGRGVEFQEGFELWNSDTQERSHHWLRDEPFYVAAVRSAERWVALGHTPEQLLPILGRSAEWDLIRRYRQPNGDLRGIWLTEPVLFEFTGS